MSAPPVANASPCFGICCPLHAQCVRYERVRVWGSHGAIPTCVTPTVVPAWPGFVAAVREASDV